MTILETIPWKEIISLFGITVLVLGLLYFSVINPWRASRYSFKKGGPRLKLSFDRTNQSCVHVQENDPPQPTRSRRDVTMPTMAVESPKEITVWISVKVVNVLENPERDCKGYLRQIYQYTPTGKRTLFDNPQQLIWSFNGGDGKVMPKDKPEYLNVVSFHSTLPGFVIRFYSGEGGAIKVLDKQDYSKRSGTFYLVVMAHGENAQAGTVTLKVDCGEPGKQTVSEVQEPWCHRFWPRSA